MRKLAFLMILALLCLALPFACAEEEISYGELFGDPATPTQLPSAGAQPAQEQMAPTPVPTATPRLEGDGSVIPNYLTPPLLENTEYYYFTNKPENFVLFKADGDQDRPNLK